MGSASASQPEESVLPKLTLLLATAALLCAASLAWSADAPRVRARDLGVPFDGVPGKWNAITDVDGVLVGQTTADLRQRRTRGRQGAGAHRGHRDPAARPASIERFSFAGWFARTATAR